MSWCPHKCSGKDGPLFSHSFGWQTPVFFSRPWLKHTTFCNSSKCTKKYLLNALIKSLSCLACKSWNYLLFLTSYVHPLANSTKALHHILRTWPCLLNFTTRTCQYHLPGLLQWLPNWTSWFSHCLLQSLHNTTTRVILSKDELVSCSFSTHYTTRGFPDCSECRCSCSDP